MDKQHTGFHCASCEIHSTDSHQEHANSTKMYTPLGISFLLLMGGIAADYFCKELFHSYFRFTWYLLAYIPVAYPVIKEAFALIAQKSIFTEFTLMSIATLGAFSIGEYPEGVAVMLFYTIGELFQDSAVNKAKRNIQSLLDSRPDTATRIKDGNTQTVSPEQIKIGELIQVKAGEKVPLDGVMISTSSSFNTSALTGESRPRTIRKGETVLAGMLNMEHVIQIEVSKVYQDSSFARIIKMVQEASSRKSPTELFIRKFAKIYTPIVFLLALLITLIPYLFVSTYVFQDWLYRGLVFLVISCPCALVISVPLSYFGGIGAASKTGILFKGANYLDLMNKVNTLVIDKTGTLTHGVFDVQAIVPANGYTKDDLLHYATAIEKFSNHPIAKAIVSLSIADDKNHLATDIQEIAGQGLKGRINSKEVLVGNARLMKSHSIQYDPSIDSIAETTVMVAIDQTYAGYITIADKLKADAETMIKTIHHYGIQKIIILSGDKQAITTNTARQLGIQQAYGSLLPADKLEHMKRLKADSSNIVAFVGDGINDAPSLALSDVGIAMGNMGSDAAIEVADIIIQTDQPSKIITAVKIARSTRKVVYQNIFLALFIKLIILVLAALGIATMWEAVFADVGVALLAILNAVRILKMKF